MKLINGNEFIEVPVNSALCGVGCDEISLSFKDMKTLYQMPPELLHEYIGGLLTRFNFPGEKS